MPDYKKLYFSLFSANQKAIEQLILAQQNAEKIFLEQESAEIIEFISKQNHPNKKETD